MQQTSNIEGIYEWKWATFYREALLC